MIDFAGLTEDEAAMFVLPFQHVFEFVKPERAKDRNKKTREQWWLFERQRVDMRKALENLNRFIIPPWFPSTAYLLGVCRRPLR